MIVILIISLIWIVNSQIQINKTGVVPTNISTKLTSFLYDYIPTEDSVVFELNIVPNSSAIIETFVLDTSVNASYFMNNSTMFYDTAVISIVKPYNLVQATQQKKTMTIGSAIVMTAIATPEIAVTYYSINSSLVIIQLKRQRLSQSQNTFNMSLCYYDPFISLQNQLQISFDLVNPFFIDCNFGQFSVCTAEQVSIGMNLYKKAQSIQFGILLILIFSLIMLDI